MIYIGTSGYSYDDWVGPYYPEDLDKKEFLSYYARDFQCTELNFTYYRMPNSWMIERIADKVPKGFLFTVKLNQQMTHKRHPEAPRGSPRLAGLFEEFTASLRPLVEQDKFGCLLAQFPYSFHNTPANQAYLRSLPEHLDGLPTVVEFRNREWIEEAVFEMLRQSDLGFCAVDQPQFKNLIPPIAEVTSRRVAYVRFHGRNYDKWWQHEEAHERYDYTYTVEELQEWVPKIKQMDAEAEKVFAFANNHYRGQAVDTVNKLRKLLGEAGANLG
jgi:uncharacterized protein YecE (DUF72 family)